MITGLIYCYTNKINGKKYIGQTIHEKRRMATHKSAKSKSSQFHSAIKKYGWDNFKYEVLYKRDFINSDDASFSLDLMEIYYISLFNTFRNGYNATEGASSCTEEMRLKRSENMKENSYWRGKHLSEETKRKISNSRVGKKYGKHQSSTIKKMSDIKRGENNPFYGKHHTEETKEKLSRINRGKIVSEEQMKIISEWNKNKIVSEETKTKISMSHSKSVVQLTIEGEFVAQFSSSKEAGIKLKISSDVITRCCNHKPHSKTAGGFKWLFYEEYKDINKLKEILHTEDAVYK